jgi:antitoxin component of MazEF toxin-antitoxin module
MKRKIIRIGNSYGIIIPKNIFKIMDWDVHALEAELDTKKKELVVKSASGK